MRPTSRAHAIAPHSRRCAPAPSAAPVRRPLAAAPAARLRRAAQAAATNPAARLRPPPRPPPHPAVRLRRAAAYPRPCSSRSGDYLRRPRVVHSRHHGRRRRPSLLRCLCSRQREATRSDLPQPCASQLLQVEGVLHRPLRQVWAARPHRWHGGHVLG